ncbi:MAG: fibronectin type III domain-containing protein [Chthoniobacterales bacterium]
MKGIHFGCPTGPFTKLTASPITPTTYTDSTGTVGTAYTYLVKTIKKETTPAGTFQNPSTASFATITASSAGTSIPPAPTNLQVSAPNSTAISLTWADNASGETGYRVERRTTPTGSFSMLATLSANSTSYTDVGPLTPGATFYYRVVTLGSAGNSLPSNEVALSGYTGSIKFDQDAFHASLPSGYADVAVRRFGGSTGTVTVNYSTQSGAADSAQPGVDYTATSGTLTFADGETLKTVRVALLKTSPQPLQNFTMLLNSPTGGAQLSQSQAAVLVEDPGAPVTAPWQSKVLGGNAFDVGGAGQIGNDLTSAFSGGLWNGGWSEEGRFTYQSVTGDTVMTMKINAPLTSTAALMVRSTVANNYSDMVSVNFSNGGTSGAQFWVRTTTTSPWPLVMPATAITIQVPYWARITRSGNFFTGEISPDGVTWTVLGSASVPGIPATALYGFFQASQWYGLQRAAVTQIGFAGVAAPTGPNSLAAARNVSGGVLTWVNTASNASGVRIERRLLPAGSFAEIASAQTPATTYTDPGASPTQAYEYRVRAYNNTGNSAYSNTASLAALDPPSTPASVTFTGSSNATVSLTWGNASTANQGYLIERRAEGEAQFTQIATTASLSYTDTTTAPDTGYEYRIRAYNQVLNSPYSSTVAGATVKRITASVTTATGQGADAQISNLANANVNYSNATTLSLYSLTINGTLVKTDGILRFDISGLPSGPSWNVVAAMMEATYSANSTYTQAGCDVILLPYLPGSWSEATVTWNTRPAVPAGRNPFMTLTNTGYPITTGTLMSADLSRILTNLTTQLGGGANSLDFYLNAINYNGTPEVFLATRENPSYAPPKLSLTLLNLAPTRATNLAGTVPSGGTVALSWTDTSTNETGFRVEVSTNGGASYSPIATLSANATSLTTSAIPGLAGDHLYRVVAFNALGDASPSITVRLAPNGPLTGIAAWFASYSLPTDGTGNGSPNAILAGDGIRNLMKYALGINPQVSGYQGRLTTGTTTVNGSTYLTLTYARPEPAPGGVTYVPEACGDLASWSGSGLVEVSSTVSNGVRTITVRDGTANGSTPRRFLRLKVTAP